MKTVDCDLPGRTPPVTALSEELNLEVFSYAVSASGSRPLDTAFQAYQQTTRPAPFTLANGQHAWLVCRRTGACLPYALSLFFLSHFCYSNPLLCLVTPTCTSFDLGSVADYLYLLGPNFEMFLKYKFLSGRAPLAQMIAGTSVLVVREIVVAHGAFSLLKGA